MDGENYSEEELIVFAKNNEEWALEQLLRKYRGFIIHLCENFYCKGAEKIDLQQEAMIGFIEAVKCFDPDKAQIKFRNFAAICIRREIISVLKRNNRKKHTVLNDALSIQNIGEDTQHGYTKFQGKLSLAYSVESPEEVFLEKEYLQEAGQRINALLTDMEREVLIRRIRGTSYREITVELDLSEKAVDNAIQRIRKKMMLFRTGETHNLRR